MGILHSTALINGNHLCRADFGNPSIDFCSSRSNIKSHLSSLAPAWISEWPSHVHTMSKAPDYSTLKITASPIHSPDNQVSWMAFHEMMSSFPSKQPISENVCFSTEKNTIWRVRAKMNHASLPLHIAPPLCPINPKLYVNRQESGISLEPWVSSGSQSPGSWLPHDLTSLSTQVKGSEEVGNQPPNPAFNEWVFSYPTSPSIFTVTK